MPVVCGCVRAWYLRACKRGGARLCQSESACRRPRCAAQPGRPGLQINHGETFVSETDTEVIPKLCKWVYNSSVAGGEKLPFPKVRAQGAGEGVTYCSMGLLACVSLPLCP